MDARARLRAKLKQKREERSGAGAAPPQQTTEDALLRVCGDNAEMLKMAHALARHPQDAHRMLRGLTEAARPTPPAEPESDEEGLPPDEEGLPPDEEGLPPDEEGLPPDEGRG